MMSAISSAELRDEWTENDKYCFHGLFSTYGRDFKKIHQIVRAKVFLLFESLLDGSQINEINN